MKKMTINELKDWLFSFRENTKVVMSVLAVLFVIDIFILVGGQFFPLTRLFAKARQLSANIKQAREDIAFSSTYKNKLTDYNTELLELEKKIILEEGLPVVLEQISKYADNSGVKILRMKPVSGGKSITKLTSQPSGSGELNREFYKQAVSLSLRAGFHQLGRFLALLESSKVFFGVQKLEIQANEQEPSRQIVTLVLELVVRKA